MHIHKTVESEIEVEKFTNIRFAWVNASGVPNGLCGICSAVVGGWLVVHGIKVRKIGESYKVFYPERRLYGETFKPVVTALSTQDKKLADDVILEAFFKELEKK